MMGLTRRVIDGLPGVPVRGRQSIQRDKGERCDKGQMPFLH